MVAAVLGTKPSLIEKDWYAVHALSILALLDHTDGTPVFSGGTSLSKGWGLIKRFSEDIDFKVTPSSTTGGMAKHSQRRAFRARVLSTLAAHAYELVEVPIVGNEGRFFTADLAYPSHFTAVHGLRPHLRIEMSFQPPTLQPVNRPIQSIIALAQKQNPEISSFPCINPVETAADKLSALAWRVCARQRNVDGDDPTIVRHLYDLAALESRVGSEPEFAELVLQTTKRDTERGGGKAPPEPVERFAAMLDLLQHDKTWAREYDDFVLQVSLCRPKRNNFI